MTVLVQPNKRRSSGDDGVHRNLLKVGTTLCSLEHLHPSGACKPSSNNVRLATTACLLTGHHPTNLIEAGIYLVAQNELVADILKDSNGVSPRVLDTRIAI